LINAHNVMLLTAIMVRWAMAELVLMTLLPRRVLHSWSVSRRCWS